MNPEIPPSPSGPLPGSATRSRARLAPLATEPAPAGRGISLRLAGVVSGLVGMLLAAGAAWGLALWLGFEQPWAAAAAAALGFTAAGLPLAWLFGNLARDLLRVPAAQGLDDPLAVGMVRSLFMELAEREWARARRYGTGAAMLLVDLDRQARLAESRGQAAVDSVLTELLRLTAPALRPADMITRFGQARLAVFLAHADATGALDVAERIRERVEKLELPQLHALAAAVPLRPTASVGVAHLRPAHLNLQALIDDAEDALMAARQAGGNCVRAAPVETSRLRAGGAWRGDDRRAKPKQDGAS